MPAPRPLDGPTIRELVRLLAEAFPRRTEIELLLAFTIGQPLGAITAEAENIHYLCLQVVNWCQTQGGDTLARLVRGACDERPHRADLHALAARLGFLAPS